MNVTALPKPKAKRAGEIVTEDSAACLFAARFGDRLRYCHTSQRWYQWDGVRWQTDRVGRPFTWARELARELAASEPDKVRFVSSKTSFAAGVERFAKSDETFAVTSEFWDRDPYKLGTPAGPIDLRTGAPTTADPSDGITRATAVTPASTVDCPRWLRFLAETFGDDVGTIRFVQQYMGYALTGDTTEHALVFGHGFGKNGKSVFLNTTAGVLGDYHITAPMDVFTVSKGERHPTELAMLCGARLVTASETEEGREWAEARIKEITGGDKITARFMRKDFFTFQPQFKLLMVGNHAPILRNLDEAIRRRFNLVAFTRTPAKPDKDLETKLRAEWPGILRWMIEGCLDWQRNGLVRPQSVLEATDEYFDDQDILGMFLREECDLDISNTWKTVAAAELFKAWSGFAMASGEKPGSHKSFTGALKKRRVTTCKVGGARGYAGVRLKAMRQPHETSQDR